jgi:hypothetical protein
MNSQTKFHLNCKLQKSIATWQLLHRFGQLLDHASGPDQSSLPSNPVQQTSIAENTEKWSMKKVGLSRGRPT